MSDLNQTVAQLLQAVSAHSTVLGKIKTDIMPVIRENNNAVATMIPRIDTLEQSVNSLVESVQALTNMVSQLQSQPQQVVQPQVELPPLDLGGFDLGGDVAQPQVVAQEQPQAQPQVVAQEQQEEQTQEAPLCRADIPLPNPETLPKESRVRANRADYFLTWDYKLANPKCTQGDIADYLGISRQTVGKYLKMTAEELNELPDYRTDEGLNAVAQPQAVAQPSGLDLSAMGIQPQVQPQVQPQAQPQPQAVAEPMVQTTAPTQEYPSDVASITSLVDNLMGDL